MDFADLVQRKKIVLCGKKLRDDDLGVLVKVLRESKVLEELSLSHNRVTLADGKLTDALAENGTIQYLHLHCSRIGNEGAKRLAEALKRNNSIQSIYLHHNQIGDEGVESLAAALVVNKTLRHVDLHHNKIGDVGAQSLAASLMVNGSLTGIVLDENDITDMGGKSLANALLYNHNIRCLGVRDCNRISGDVGWEIGTLASDIDPRRKLGGKGLLQLCMEEKDDEIARLKGEIASQDKQIASLKTPFDQMKTIMETIDLISGRNETSAKRPREEESNLATIQRKNQKIACIKQEKTGVEERLANVIEEKEATEADLEEVRGDLDVEKETVEHQLRATDVWHRRFDEIANLAAVGPVDGAVIAEIRNRSLAGGS